MVFGGQFLRRNQMTVSRRKRKPSEIPPSELRKRLVNAGKHPMAIDAVIEQRMAKARKKQSEGGIKGLRIRRAPAYKPHLADLSALIKKIRERIDYIQRTESSEGDDTHEYKTSMGFLQICLTQALHARDALKRHAQLGRVAPAQWQELISQQNHAERHNARIRMSGRMQDRLARIEAALSGVKESSSQ